MEKDFIFPFLEKGDLRICGITSNTISPKAYNVLIVNWIRLAMKKILRKLRTTFREIYPQFHRFWLSVSIIHLRCIREVFSDALSSLPISGYFCIISAPTVTPAWLWKSQTASVIATCYARASTKAKKK